MRLITTEHCCRTDRHTSFYLASGPEDGTPIVFVHGWPMLSIAWKHQVQTFGNLGFRAVAPDMRGYGRSGVYPGHADYALEHVVADMIELLDSLGAEKAVWVGHDWGAPAVWALAQHHPDRCLGVANLCIPYIPEGFSPETIIPLSDRATYPEDAFPAAQWDYQLYYRESFDDARAAFEGDVRAAVKRLLRSGNPDLRGKPHFFASVRRNGGFFGPGGTAPDMPRDEVTLSQEDEDAYVEALTRNGFLGPNSWYVNSAANAEYALRAKDRWRLEMPVLFVHAEFDVGCETMVSSLAEPMRGSCADLTEEVVSAGHGVAQEKPWDVNAALAKWLARRVPEAW